VVPTGHDLAAICTAVGFDVHTELWPDVTGGRRVDRGEGERVRFTRTRLCLPEERAPEVAAALAELGEMRSRDMATIWWDVRR